jgi:hypothetical protein
LGRDSRIKILVLVPPVFIGGQFVFGLIRGSLNDSFGRKVSDTATKRHGTFGILLLSSLASPDAGVPNERRRCRMRARGIAIRT